MRKLQVSRSKFIRSVQLYGSSGHFIVTPHSHQFNVLALNDDKCSNELETAYTTKSSLAIDYLYRFSKDSNYWKYILVIKIYFL